MEPLAELLATNERQALEFFLVGLKDVSDADVDQRELLYNASVLAHYAQVSTHAHADMPTPASLAAVFDQFVVDDTLREDSTLLERLPRSACCSPGSSSRRCGTATTSAGTPTSARDSSAVRPSSPANAAAPNCWTSSVATSSHGVSAMRGSARNFRFSATSLEPTGDLRTEVGTQKSEVRSRKSELNFGFNSDF
jgi:hypothetical protein